MIKLFIFLFFNVVFITANFNTLDSTVSKALTVKSSKILHDLLFDISEISNDNIITVDKNVNTDAFNKKIIANITRALNTVVNSEIGVLVADNSNAQIKAKRFISDIFATRRVNHNFLLMQYNASGVSTILGNVAEIGRSQFLELIYRQEQSSTNYIGEEEHSNGGAVFFSILKLCRVLKRNSGIIIFADSMTIDEDLSAITIKEVLEKRIKLFVVWNGMYPTKNKDELILLEAANLSKGLFIASAGKSENLYAGDSANNAKQSILLYRSNLRGKNDIPVPIDSTVTAIHVTVTAAALAEAKLLTPNGYTIDLLNPDAVRAFSVGSYTNTDGNLLNVQLNVAHTRDDGNSGNDDDVDDERDGQTTRGYVGGWRLVTREDDTVKGTTQLTVAITTTFEIAPKIVNDTQYAGKRILRLDLLGDYQRLSNVQFIDRYGAPIDQKIRFHLRENQAQTASVNSDVETIDIETLQKNEIDIPFENVPNDPLYVRINGTDKKGNPFVRMSYINRVSILNMLPPTTIEVGVRSEILATPNRGATVYFEVTNNRDQMAFIRFGCRDEHSTLVSLTPTAAYISPGQTVTATLKIYMRPTVATNQLTFSAFTGNTDRYTKTVLVRTNSYNGQPSYDGRDGPQLWRTFDSDCMGVVRCEEKTWTVKVTARARTAGLLVLTSSPIGLRFPLPYTSGTVEEVEAYYSASCCDSRIQIIAYDANYNRRYLDIDAYWAPLRPAVIAAIVLGVLMLVLIIAGIILFVRMRRNKTISIDMPTYRGPTSSSSTKRY